MTSWKFFLNFFHRNIFPIKNCPLFSLNDHLIDVLHPSSVIFDEFCSPSLFILHPPLSYALCRRLVYLVVAPAQTLLLSYLEPTKYLVELSNGYNKNQIKCNTCIDKPNVTWFVCGAITLLIHSTWCHGKLSIMQVWTHKWLMTVTRRGLQTWHQDLIGALQSHDWPSYQQKLIGPCCHMYDPF